jgi:hypothetical protein
MGSQNWEYIGDDPLAFPFVRMVVGIF